jgi:homoserine O-acetyltransferase/O-succinyltransferase
MVKAELKEVDYERFELGTRYVNPKLLHRTQDLRRSQPAVVYSFWYSGTHTDNEWLILGSDNVLSDYYVICPNMFANGLSSSPSNQLLPYDA